MAPMSDAADAPGRASRKAILVVDDDADIRQTLEMTLQYEGFEVWTARSGTEALARLEREPAPPALVLTDVKMPGLDGLELLDRIAADEGAPPVVLISGHGDVPVAVDAMQRGAVNFLEKPLDEHRLLVTVHRAIREQDLVVENRGLKRQLRSGHELIGESDAMKQLAETIARVASTDASVLITGENGVGKELVARNLHLGGDRAAGPFVTVNCAAIPAELVESELFGHVKGSFTGAHEDRVGHFEASHGGDLFLDEVGDMPLPAQAKVLRALESHEIVRVGDSTSRAVDLRVLAATNADLGQAVEDRSFRLDLYYRLNVVAIDVPPLRERREDVPLIARHLLERQAERIGRSPLTLSPEAEEALRSHDWPGNVRQLRNVLEAAAIFCDEQRITADDVARVLSTGPALGAGGRPDATPDGPFEAETFEQFKNEAEALFFERRLERNGGNVKRTAEELGMQRSHLYKKLDRYGLR
jgi:DNA-binding NtrC family response regulator